MVLLMAGASWLQAEQIGQRFRGIRSQMVRAGYKFASDDQMYGFDRNYSAGENRRWHSDESGAGGRYLSMQFPASRAGRS